MPGPVLRLKEKKDMRQGKCHANLCDADSSIIYGGKAAAKFRRQNDKDEVELCDAHVEKWCEVQEAPVDNDHGDR